MQKEAMPQDQGYINDIRPKISWLLTRLMNISSTFVES
jgi:hypothetical protein